MSSEVPFMNILILFIFLILHFIFVNPVQAHSIKDATVIHMEDEKYEPQNVTVEKDSIVIFENVGKNDHWPASNIHPTHGIYPEFDPKKPIKSGETWQFKFEKAGNWKFHDHLYPSLTGIINVSGESAQSNRSFLSRFTENFKDFWVKIYFKLFPKAIEEKFSKLNMQTFEDEDEIKRNLKIFGVEKIRNKLFSDSGGGSKFDCHQQAHKLGRMSYEIFNIKAFQTMDTSCHSGLIHGAMEAFLKEKGTANLASDIKSLCDDANSAFGRFECLHGVGHGVMAFDDYDMPSALDSCKKLADDYSRESCYGGVFMENIIVSEGNGVVPAHQTKWINSDPHFPCNGIDQEERLQIQCYLMQTSRMLDLYGYDFNKVAKVCEGAPQNMRYICFQSMGRDASGQTLRDPLKTDSICKLAPSNYYEDCLRGALYVFIEFWGDNMTNQPHGFCQALNESDKSYCYSLLGARLPEIFGNSDQKIREICQFAETNYQSNCLKASGLN